MRILVIEDNPLHRRAAEQSLAEHDLTVCEDADEALKLLWQNWDVVLTDLLMPAPRDNQGDRGMRFVGEEMPIGWAFALQAVLCGAKYAAVVTDADHHDHPASALMDGLGTGFHERAKPPKFVVNGTVVGFYNYHVVTLLVEGEKCPNCDGTGEGNCEYAGVDGEKKSTCSKCLGRKWVRGKNWAGVLAHLTKDRQ